MINKKTQKYEKYDFRWYVITHTTQKYYEDTWSEYGCEEENRQVMFRYATWKDAQDELRRQCKKARNDVEFLERKKEKVSSLHYIEVAGFDDGEDYLHTLEEHRFEYTPDEE